MLETERDRGSVLLKVEAEELVKGRKDFSGRVDQ